MIQLYTGNGKGKTTAALGLAFRAAGSGKKAIVIQFMKKGDFSELKSAESTNGRITIEQYGSSEFYFQGKSDYIHHRGFAKAAIDRSKEILTGGEYSLLVLDEVVHALNFSLITFDEIQEIITSVPAETELVLTGRDAPEALIDLCDLVTEMKEIKHYYSAGNEAREGFEF